MIMDIIGRLLLAPGARPLSGAAAASAVVVPGSLLLYLTHPTLGRELGTPALVLLSIAVSAPVLLLCSLLVYAPLNALREGLRETQPDEPITLTDWEAILARDDALEWPSLLVGGWLANAILYGLTALTYLHPIRVGSTLLLVAGALLGCVLVLTAAAHLALRSLRRGGGAAE